MEPFDEEDDRFPDKLFITHARPDGTEEEAAFYFRHDVARRCCWLMFAAGALTGYTLTLLAR